MKNIAILLVTCFCFLSFGQTDSLEKALLYEKVKKEEISLKTFSELGKKWNDLRLINDYPQMSRNPSGQVHMSSLIDYSGENKDYLFNRVLEWLAIRYEMYPQYLYANSDAGKIIFTNSFVINDKYTCIYTGIITCRDDKLLLETLNIKYQIYHAGYSSYTSWVPERIETIEIDKMFPIILQPSNKWEGYFIAMNSLQSRFEIDVKSLQSYIVNFRKLNRF